MIARVSLVVVTSNRDRNSYYEDEDDDDYDRSRTHRRERSDSRNDRDDDNRSPRDYARTSSDRYLDQDRGEPVVHDVLQQHRSLDQLRMIHVWPNERSVGTKTVKTIVIVNSKTNYDSRTKSTALDKKRSSLLHIQLNCREQVENCTMRENDARSANL
jgi:hypothetical protein